MKRIYTTFLSLIICFVINAQVPAGYYDNAIGKSGETLKSALNDIISGHTELSYSECWDALKVTDRDPSNSNNVIGIYSRFSMDAAGEYAGGSGWNREHVWAKSRGDFGTSRGAGTDIHHLRACDVSTNSARSNKAFDDGGTTYVDASGNYSGTTPVKRDGDSWEPGDNQKGDVARMIFYMATRYEGENGEPDLELTDQIFGTSDKQPLHGRISALLIWHEEDPVDQEEMDRHEGIYSFQNNRNPFIDHPEWVDEIWGDGSSTTASIDISVNSGLDFGEVAAGQSSPSESYTVSGVDLESDISVSVSAPFEVSLNNTTWALSRTISQATAESAGQIVYIRFSPINQDGQTFNQNVTHTSTNASTVNLSITGSESTDVGDPAISTSKNSIDFGEIPFGESSVESYTVSAVNLESDLTITPPDEINLSLVADFSSDVYTSSLPLTLSQSEGVVEQTTVYARYAPVSDNGASFEEEIIHSSADASKTIGVIGSEFSEPELPTAWINEFHYANSGADQNEFIELFLADAEEYNLSDFTIELVESDGSVYSSFLASTMTQGMDGYYSRNFGGIKDGPNGIRVRYTSDVVHSVSYGGPISDFELITVEEGENTNAETSIQLCCDEISYDDMEWTSGSIATPGEPNANITLGLFDEKVFIYPNPTKGPIHLEGFTGELKITLRDLTGKRLVEKSGSKEKMEKLLERKIEAFKSGTYILNVKQEEVDISFKLFVQD